MDNLVRKLFSKAETKWQRRALLVILMPYLVLSHLRNGLKVFWDTLTADVKGAWNV